MAAGEGLWELVLCERAGVPIVDMTPAILEAVYRVRKDQPRVLEIEVPSNADILALTHTDGKPYISEMRTVKFWRRSGHYGGNQFLTSVHYVYAINDEGQGDRQRTRMICYDPTMRLQQRLVRNASNNFAKLVNFKATTPQAIVSALINRSTNGGGAFGFNSGFSAGGGTAIDVILELKTIAEAMGQLAPLIEWDYDFGGVWYDSTIEKFLDLVFRAPGGTHTTSGQDPDAWTQVGYATEPFNCESMSRQSEVQFLANDIRTYGGSGLVRVNARDTDATSQTDYGLHEATVAYPDIRLQGQIDTLGDIAIALRKRPKEIVQWKPLPDAELNPLDWDFMMHDLLNVRAGAVLRGGFSGVQRVYGYDVSLRDGIERVDAVYTGPS